MTIQSKTFEEMRKWALEHCEKNRSDATKRTYIAEIKRMNKRGELRPSAANCRTRSVQRSALRLMWSVKTRSAVEEGNLELTRFFVEKLLTLEKEADQNWEQRQGGGVDNKIKRSSKKRSLTGLPEDWRTRFLNRAEDCRGNKPSKYFEAMCVLAACGCRPSELAKGVYVTVDPAQENLVFEITGSKVTNENGYKKRTVAISLDSPLSNRVRLGLVVADARALNKAVVRIGRDVFPGRSEEKQISPYTFRHAIAADFKYWGGSDAEVAQALGHRSTQTKALYAYRRGKGVQKLARVEVQETVRDHGKSELPKSVMRMGLVKRGRADNRNTGCQPSGG